MYFDITLFHFSLIYGIHRILFIPYSIYTAAAAALWYTWLSPINWMPHSIATYMYSANGLHWHLYWKFHSTSDVYYSSLPMHVTMWYLWWHHVTRFVGDHRVGTQSVYGSLQVVAKSVTDSKKIVLQGKLCIWLIRESMYRTRTGAIGSG